MARTWMPTLPIGGVVTGTATVNGSTDAAARGRRRHRPSRSRHAVGSRRDGDGSAARAAQWFDVDVIAHPVSLVEVGRFFPGRRTARKRDRTGAPHGHAERLARERRPPAARRRTLLDARHARSREPRQGLRSHGAAAARSICARSPTRRRSRRSRRRSRRAAAASIRTTMRSTVAADLSTSRWDSIAVDTASVRANARPTDSPTCNDCTPPARTPSPRRRERSASRASRPARSPIASPSIRSARSIDGFHDRRWRRRRSRRGRASPRAPFSARRPTRRASIARRRWSA